MSLNIQYIDNEAEWNNQLLALPQAHALQSWHWGDFKSRWEWTAKRLLFKQDGVPLAAAQILQRPIPYTTWNFLYVPKGPVVDYDNLKLVAQVLAELERYAANNNSIFIKIDPDVAMRYGESPEKEFRTLAPLVTGQTFFNLLNYRGWQFSPEQIQFKNTVTVDLTADEAILLATMKSKWRYNIRLAERKGVTIKQGGVEDISAFYQMYAETAGRDNFLIRPAAYYHDVWQTFMRDQQAEMLLAIVDGQPVAGLMLFIFGQTAWYLYGASTGQYRELMPNHLLQWTAMQRAKARGCTQYDMWGAPDSFTESDPMWGVYRFKQGFGGQTVQGLGAWDYPVKPILYWMFTVALPRVRSLLRRGTST